MALPLPTLQVRTRADLSFLTDEALFDAAGVRLGFTRRAGGASPPPFDSLNLGSHVGDDLSFVRENRARLLRAAGLDHARLLTLNQVHGSQVLTVDDAAEGALARVQQAADEGADGVAVDAAGVCALLCFADCVPVVAVSPTGAFAVAHAGWRGALAGIPKAAVEALVALDARAGREADPAQYNAYIGPHIMTECYEAPDLVPQFAERYGAACDAGDGRLNLQAAVSASLIEAGIAPRRIAAAGECTACHPDQYFSYRASGGRCGRHGAFAGRKE